MKGTASSHRKNEKGWKGKGDVTIFSTTATSPSLTGQEAIEFIAEYYPELLYKNKW